MATTKQVSVVNMSDAANFSQKFAQGAATESGKKSIKEYRE